jgi:hypothetical protein
VGEAVDAAEPPPGLSKMQQMKIVEEVSEDEAEWGIHCNECRQCIRATATVWTES